MTTYEQPLQTARALLAKWGAETTTPEPNRLDVAIQPADLLPAVTALHEARWGYLAAITGLDLGAESQTIEVLYQFCAGAAVVTLRVRVPYSAATVASICGIIPSASFFERELIEMLGVSVEGTPSSAHLFLPDNWPAWVYPLRKSFVAENVTHAPEGTV